MEKEKCNTIEDLFTMLNNKCRPQFNEITKLLQFPKLSRQSVESAEEWMGRLRLAAIDCKYKEIDRALKEQFIPRGNDIDMLSEIILDLAKVEENTEITSENILCEAKRVEAQRAQSAIINSLTDTREFDKLT